MAMSIFHTLIFIFHRPGDIPTKGGFTGAVVNYWSGAYARVNARSTSKSKCVLWDIVEQRRAQEVSEAAKRALEELKKSRPHVDAKNIIVDVPPPPPRAPAPAVPVPTFNNAPYPRIIHGRHIQNYYQPIPPPPPQPYIYAAQ
ncbi:hypothetical protein BU15DRAFT_78727 [Melanogaster broomeanus]|nr:hypothetical protein BU15DRAFT_78727 [Melanogaster broomeanus]